MMWWMNVRGEPGGWIDTVGAYVPRLCVFTTGIDLGEQHSHVPNFLKALWGLSLHLVSFAHWAGYTLARFEIHQQSNW